MKLDFCLLLTLLCCNNCLSQSSDGSVTCGNPKRSGKIKFTDLNLDVLRLIMEQLDFIDLLNVAEMNSSISVLASDVVRLRYYLFNVYNPDTLKEKFEVREVDRNVDIRNTDIILRAMKQFSSVIYYLHISDQRSESNRSTITSELTKGCSYDSLKYFYIWYIENNTFDKLAIAFPEVEMLSLNKITEEVKTQSLPLNQQFPKLRQLSIGSKSDRQFNCSFLNLHFPFLEQFTMGGVMQLWFEDDQIEAFLKKNPQIRTISLSRISAFDDIGFVHRLLPNVESLTIYYLNIKSDSVHFDHVKYFKLQDSRPYTLEKLSFSCLASLEMSLKNGYFNTWREFFKRNMNLSRLNMKLDDKEMNDKLVEITAELPNLLELSITTYYHVDADVIIQLIGNHPKLNKFEGLIYASGYDWEPFLESLRNTFENDWHIQCVNRGNGSIKLILERKSDNVIQYD